VGDKKATEKTSQALREGLAGCSGSGDDVTVTASGGCIKKVSKPLQSKNQSNGDGRIISAGNVSSSDESQKNSVTTTASTSDDDKRKDICKSEDTAHVPSLNLQQCVGKWSNRKGLTIGGGHVISSGHSSPFLSRVVSSP